MKIFHVTLSILVFLMDFQMDVICVLTFIMWSGKREPQSRPDELVEVVVLLPVVVLSSGGGGVQWWLGGPVVVFTDAVAIGGPKWRSWEW